MLFGNTNQDGEPHGTLDFLRRDIDLTGLVLNDQEQDSKNGLSLIHI